MYGHFLLLFSIISRRLKIGLSVELLVLTISSHGGEAPLQNCVQIEYLRVFSSINLPSYFQ